MRLGGPVQEEYDSPDAWIMALRRLGYRAAVCPVPPGADDPTVRAYSEAAAEADIVIAEVGAWSNPLSPDDEIRGQAFRKCCLCLDLADRIGAKCCVNISGSVGEKWDGPCAEDLTAETFDLIVETVRRIVDTVRPTRTYYTLETMPWMYPDSADSYLRLLKAIDRERVGVHFDPVNLVCSPQRYFRNGELIRDCIAKLGKWLHSCHAKDIVLRPNLTTHLDEVCAGRGGLDYRVFLSEVAKLSADIPIMLEHLSDPADYRAAADFIRGIAGELQIDL